MAGLLTTLLGAPVPAPAPAPPLGKGGLLTTGLGAGQLPSLGSLPGSLPSVPTVPGVGGLDAVLAAAGDPSAAAQQAAASAQAAVDAGISQAAQAANAAAVAALDKYGMAPAVVSVENGDYATGAEQAAVAILNDVGIPPTIANELNVVESDAASAAATTTAVAEAVAWAIQQGLLDFLGPVILNEIGSILATMGVTIGAGAAAGSSVPVVGTAIGLIIGALIAAGEYLTASFPCDAKQLTYQQFWRYADLGTLQQGDSCGLGAALAHSKGTASADEQEKRKASVETMLQTTVAQIRAAPGWQKGFLAIYAKLRSGDASTPALYVWSPINGYQYMLADEVFRRLGDEFADWWIQQPGWLTALGALPVLPVSAQQVWTTDGITQPGGAMHNKDFKLAIEEAYADYRDTHGGQNPPYTPGTFGEAPLNDTSLKAWLLPTGVVFKNRGPLTSNLPAMLASHIPGAIGRAILNRYAITPHNATPSDWSLAMINAAGAADALGSKAVSDYVGAHISEVGPQIGYQMKPVGWLGIMAAVPYYGPPGAGVPAGVIPLAAPIWRSSAIGGGAAPLRPGALGTTPPSARKPGQTLVGKLGGLHTSGGLKPPTQAPILIANPPTLDVPTAGAILGAAAGGDPGAGAYVAGTVGSANSGHPTGIANAEQFTRAQRLAILARFAARYVSPAAASQVRAGLVLR